MVLASGFEPEPRANLALISFIRRPALHELCEGLAFPHEPWYPTADSNCDYAPFEGADSAVGLGGHLVGAEGFELSLNAF